MQFDIPHLEPNMGGNEGLYAHRAIAAGEPCQGEYLEQFERLVAQATGRAWCVATSSGTASLHLALLAMEASATAFALTTPSFTFCATANAIIQAGCTPHFVDIDPNTWIADRAFVPVEALGNPCTGPYGIVDAAASIGRGKIGGTLACLSFNGNKTITCGGGGAIVGDDPDLEEKLRELRYPPHFNYRMPNVNAAIGCAQMERLDELAFKKFRIYERYRAALENYLPGPDISARWLSGYMSNQRDYDILALRDQGIEARPFWTPLHLQDQWKEYPRDDLPVTEEIWQKIVTLPSSTTLTDEQQDRVIDAVLSLPQAEQTPHRSSM
jgi:dTDP-4-amino-4,6-dideoxygalactose transaminase